MFDIFDAILRDRCLIDLKKRIEGARRTYLDGVVMVAGYEHDNPERQTIAPLLYLNTNEFQKRFCEKERSVFNGRIMAHTFGTNEYHCLTDIIDNEDEILKGCWTILGYGPKGEKVQALFPTKEEMMKRKEGVLNQITERAIIHQYGTQDYTLVETTIALDLDDVIIDDA